MGFGYRHIHWHVGSDVMPLTEIMWVAADPLFEVQATFPKLLQYLDSYSVSMHFVFKSYIKYEIEYKLNSAHYLSGERLQCKSPTVLTEDRPSAAVERGKSFQRNSIAFQILNYKETEALKGSRGACTHHVAQHVGRGHHLVRPTSHVLWVSESWFIID
ncbi:hypothetical protein AV530_019676 [Patagioenas fasciata monilis]|uniref:Uncharacterized protein n=1 Tax=Patagioenas fasciata monilis TaxID=372326 RepID=A0A1V4JE52_PATFA|nr:hypothetical protein AV530_019676 [Patagioenas fasciata monilis]